ncbi:MAG: hypothetical protein ACYTFA_16715 [Planctomycetota bacterium]
MFRINGRIALFLFLGLHIGIHRALATDGWFWTQNDWSGGLYDSADGIDAEVEPGELVLDSDPDRLVLAFDATDYAGVWALCQWRDQLYLGACDSPGNAHGGDILIYDYATDSVAFDYAVNEQGICVLKVHEDVIYSPGIDSMGSWDFGNLYYNDGGGWVRKETIPSGIHVFDVDFWDGRVWVSTGTALLGYPGVLYSSDDMGDTWTEEFRVDTVPPETFRRLWGMTAWNASLFVQGDSKPPEGEVIYELTGESTITHSVSNLGPQVLSGFVEFQGRLACIPKSGMVHFYDGIAWSFRYVPISSNVIRRALCVYRDRLYVGGNEALFAMAYDEAWLQIDAPLAGREVEALAQHHGRLYAGTLGSGEVFVTPTVSEGVLVSLPRTFTVPMNGGSLSWSALLPSAETSVSLQLRSAPTVDLLSEALFLGPDGSPDTWYVRSGTPISDAHNGDQHFQYRVRLSTEQPRLAPVLTSVILTMGAGPVPTAHPIGLFALAVMIVGSGVVLIRRH